MIKEYYARLKHSRYINKELYDQCFELKKICLMSKIGPISLLLRKHEVT